MRLPKDPLLLIDGHALLFRAFHALPPLKTKDGLQTNAVYGFVTTIFKALEEIKPKYWAVAFDVSGPTFRTELFEGYKASRAETPVDLSSQIPYAYKIAEALNIPVLTSQGFEADDVIGTLADQAKKTKTPVVILTGDRDSFQLIDDSTSVYLMRRNAGEVTLFDAEAVKESMGISPTQITDYKALAGDSSDEIPGIAGIGPKTAVTILQTYPTIETLYEGLSRGEQIPNITDRIRQKLVDGEASARQSLELATIRKDVPVTLDLPTTVIHDYDFNAATQVFQSLEFFSLIKRLHALAPSSQKTEFVAEQKRDWTYKLVTSEKEIKALVDDLMKAKDIAVDTETDGIRGVPIGISLSTNGNEGYYIPLSKDHGAELGSREIADIVRPLLENETIGKIGHNLKYDIHSLSLIDIKVKPVAFDTMIAAYILSPHLHRHIRTLFRLQRLKEWLLWLYQLNL